MPCSLAVINQLAEEVKAQVGEGATGEAGGTTAGNSSSSNNSNSSSNFGTTLSTVVAGVELG